MQITKVNKLMFMKVLELFSPKYYLSISCWEKGLRKSTKVLKKNIQNDGPTDEQSLDEDNGNFSCI